MSAISCSAVVNVGCMSPTFVEYLKRDLVHSALRNPQTDREIKLEKLWQILWKKHFFIHFEIENFLYHLQNAWLYFSITNSIRASAKCTSVLHYNLQMCLLHCSEKCARLAFSLKFRLTVGVKVHSKFTIGVSVECEISLLFFSLDLHALFTLTSNWIPIIYTST